MAVLFDALCRYAGLWSQNFATLWILGWSLTLNRKPTLIPYTTASPLVGRSFTWTHDSLVLSREKGGWVIGTTIRNLKGVSYSYCWWYESCITLRTPNYGNKWYIPRYGKCGIYIISGRDPFPISLPREMNIRCLDNPRHGHARIRTRGMQDFSVFQGLWQVYVGVVPYSVQDSVLYL